MTGAARGCPSRGGGWSTLLAAPAHRRRRQDLVDEVKRGGQPAGAGLQLHLKQVWPDCPVDPFRVREQRVSLSRYKSTIANQRFPRPTKRFHPSDRYHSASGTLAKAPMSLEALQSIRTQLKTKKSLRCVEIPSFSTLDPAELFDGPACAPRVIQTAIAAMTKKQIVNLRHKETDMGLNKLKT